MAQSVRAEIDTFVRQRLERLVADMDFVPREEFEAVKAMAAKARTENEALAARIAALEAKSSTKPRLRFAVRESVAESAPSQSCGIFSADADEEFADSCATTKSCASLGRNCFVLCFAESRVPA